MSDLQTKPLPDKRRGRTYRALRLMVLVLLVYGGIAYLLLPELWTHYEHQTRLATTPMITMTEQGIPGDPINVGVIGDRKDLLCAMHAAGWYPADPVTLRSSLEIVDSVLLDRPYPEAPVSTLIYLGRREDLAFEKPAGISADHRHHVRLWQVFDKGAEDRPVWLGDATFDRSVGISTYTGAVTHHIAPDIDTERTGLAKDLEKAGMVEAKYQVTGIGPTVAGRNGGGDLYYTDGEVWLIRLVTACTKTRQSGQGLFRVRPWSKSRIGFFTPLPVLSQMPRLCIEFRARTRHPSSTARALTSCSAMSP